MIARHGCPELQVDEMNAILPGGNGVFCALTPTEDAIATAQSDEVRALHRITTSLWLYGGASLSQRGCAVHGRSLTSI